jgi:hypothetical protein
LEEIIFPADVFILIKKNYFNVYCYFRPVFASANMSQSSSQPAFVATHFQLSEVTRNMADFMNPSSPASDTFSYDFADRRFLFVHQA